MSNYPFIFGARGGGGGTPSIPFSINGTEEETLTEAFNLVATLDGIPGGIYDDTTDTLSFATTPAILQRNAIQIKTLANASTFNLKTKLDGTANNGIWDGVDTLDFTSSGGWQRPSYWRTLPTLTAASEAGYILVFVYENRLNQFTCQIYNNAAIDWGDGTTSAPTTAVRTKTYTYSTIAQTVFVDPVTGENYKQVIISITRSGGAITYVDFTVASATLPNIAPQFAVDYNLSFPNCTEFRLGGVFTREPRFAQILRIWSLGAITVCRIMNALNLKILQIPTTFSGNFNGAFASRIGSVAFPDINTGTAIGIGGILSGSYIVSHGNLIANSAPSLGYYQNTSPNIERFGSVTANLCTSITYAWESCTALTSIGLLTLPICTDYSAAFAYCHSLVAIRVANAAACTNTTSMLVQCYSLQVLDMPNLTRGVNFTNSIMGNYGMNIFANSLGTASGAQTITITGTPFGALVTAADVTALAIQLVMTTKGYTIAN